MKKRETLDIRHHALQQPINNATMQIQKAKSGQIFISMDYQSIEPTVPLKLRRWKFILQEQGDMGWDGAHLLRN